MAAIDQNLREQLALLQTRGATLMQERKEFFIAMDEDWSDELDDYYSMANWID